MRTDALYARYSSDAQSEGSSIQIQIEQCTRALGNGPVTHYTDEAKTGRARAGRTGLQQLLADAKAGLIKRVAFWRYSRVGRNLAESAQIIQELEDAGCQVISAMEGSDPLVRGIFLSVAEHYSRELASNTREGLVKRFEQRAFCGGVVPFGYQVVQDGNVRRLAVNDQEAETIRRLTTVYLGETIGLKSLSRRMELEGIPSRRGARWCHTTLRTILINPMLVGQVRFLRRQMKLNRNTGRRVPKFRDEPEVMTYTDETLRILTDDQFEKIQQLIQSRGNSKPTTPRLPREVRAFTGLAFCGECGAPCYTCKSQNSKGVYHYLACGTRCRHGRESCPASGRIREDVVLDQIQQEWAGIFNDTDQIIGEVIEAATSMASTNQQEIDRVTGEMKALDRKIASMVGLLADPVINEAAKRAVSKQIGDCQQERERLEAVVGRLAREANGTTERLAGAVRQALDEARASLAGVMEPAELNRFVARLVGAFVVRGDGTWVQKNPGRMLSHPTGDIAGGRSLPGRVGTDEADAVLRAVFWARRAA